MSNYITRVRNPHWYHGHNAKPPFFEGWYFKLVNAAENARFAVIPGIFHSQDADKQHAFIQVLDGNTATSYYYRFPFDDFQAEKEAFSVSIGDNYFSDTHIRLNLADGQQPEIQGEIQFDGTIPWPVTWTAPGIMGWFGWLPNMECNHGVVSMDHGLRGELRMDGITADFNQGRGYIEKDWGRSFPAGWVWQQGNHFDTVGTSFMLSIAHIPFGPIDFQGFLCGVWHEQKLYRFATYLGSKVTRMDVSDDKVIVQVKGNGLTLDLETERAIGGVLKAPTTTDMTGRIAEALTASVKLTLRDKDDQIIVSQEGRNCGLEVGGTYQLA